MTGGGIRAFQGCEPWVEVYSPVRAGIAPRWRTGLFRELRKRLKSGGNCSSTIKFEKGDGISEENSEGETWRTRCGRVEPAVDRGAGLVRAYECSLWLCIHR